MERLIKIFNHFAEHEAKGNSPLYEYWCHRIVEDPDLLSLIQYIPTTQPKPNLFFASVQYLTNKTSHPLLQIYEDASNTNLLESFEIL